MKILTIFGACLMGFALYAVGIEDSQLVGPLFEFDWSVTPTRSDREVGQRASTLP